MPKQIKVKCHPEPVIVIHRAAFRTDKLVYIARTNKELKYPLGKSRIAYIGTTKNGAGRIASSAVDRGEKLLERYGMKHLEFSVVTCGKIQSVKTWEKLERALLIRFRELYGRIPDANKAGKKMPRGDEMKYFRSAELDKILKDMGA